jgi:hypothetical protein
VGVIIAFPKYETKVSAHLASLTSYQPILETGLADLAKAGDRLAQLVSELAIKINELPPSEQRSALIIKREHIGGLLVLTREGLVHAVSQIKCAFEDLEKRSIECVNTAP